MLLIKKIYPLNYLKLLRLYLIDKYIIKSKPYIWQFKINCIRKQLYSQEKNFSEYCNIGTIGHVDHGKTTLTAAITKYLSQKNKNCKFVAYDEIDRAPEEKARGITINIAHINYETKKRKYVHIDCPGHLDFIKNMISGASQMDGAILIVAANDGIMPQTVEHLLLIKQLGIKSIVVYINKAEIVDEETLDLAEIEIQELMEKYGFNILEGSIIRGSALLALNGNASKFGTPSIQTLLNAIDKYIVVPERDYKSPFIIPIDNFFRVTGRGTVVTGTIKKGTIQKGVEAKLMGYNDIIKTNVVDIQAFNKSIPEALAGENVGVLLKGVKIEDIRRGMWLCAKNAGHFSNHYESQIYLLHTDEGGRYTPLGQYGYCTMLYSSTWNIYTRIDFLLPKGTKMVMPGEQASARLITLHPMPMLLHQNFTVREQNQTIACGKITKICESIQFDSRKMNKIDIPVF